MPSSIIVEPSSINGFDVILVAGQSNTHFGLGLDGVIDSPHPNIWQLGRFGLANKKVVPAIEPLDFISKNKNRIGFSMTFAKKMISEGLSTRNILIIPCGMGGTGFVTEDWNPGDDMYQDAVSRAARVFSRYPKSEIKAILWHQGERDANRANLNFEQQIDTFIDHLRIDLGDSTIPLVLGGMVPYWVDQDSSRQFYQDILKTRSFYHNYVAYADPEIPFRIDKSDPEEDPIHYDASGQRELAMRYFDAYLDILREKGDTL